MVALVAEEGKSLEIKRLPGREALRFSVDDIPSAGLERVVALDDAWLRPLLVVQYRPTDAPVEVWLRAERVGNGVAVRARLQLVVDGDCSRCAETARFEGRAQWRSLYSAAQTSGVRLGSGTPTVDEDGELDFWPLADNHVDIEPAVAEQAVFALPDYPLCKPDCRGLCGGCGANLNLQPCRCAAPAPDPRWQKLKALRDKLGERS